MLPDRVSNPGPLTYESGALPIALRGPAPFCEIISKSVHRFRRRSCLKLISIYSPGSHFVPQERNGLSNFGKQSSKEHSCIIISKSMHWLRRRSRLKVFSIFSPGSHLVQPSRTV